MKVNLLANHRGVRLFRASFLVARGLVLAFCMAVMLVGCVSVRTPQPTPAQASTSRIANPASVNCVRQGGTLIIRKRGDGGEYGVCVFEDNRQCEEWALFRGECPVGGVRITGYVTPAAQYCAITGGEYQVTGYSNSGREQGVCIFRNGSRCEVWDYYNGKCRPDSTAKTSVYNDPFGYCAAVGTIDTPDERYTGPIMPDSIVKAMSKQGIVPADAPSEFRRNAVWRCMNHHVWVCHFGANLPCLEKADMSQAPTPAMEDFCKANPAAQSIPAAVTGSVEKGSHLFY